MRVAEADDQDVVQHRQVVAVLERDPTRRAGDPGQQDLANEGCLHEAVESLATPDEIEETGHEGTLSGAPKKENAAGCDLVC